MVCLRPCQEPVPPPSDLTSQIGGWPHADIFGWYADTPLRMRGHNRQSEEMRVASLDFRKVLKSVNRAQLSKAANLPPTESVVFDKAGQANADQQGDLVTCHRNSVANRWRYRMLEQAPVVP